MLGFFFFFYLLRFELQKEMGGMCCVGPRLEKGILNSLQSITWSFWDGGTDMVTGIYGSRNLLRYPLNYQTRHILTSMATIISQLLLSSFFLRHMLLSNRKRKG
jgi:hypothetical protein